MKRVNFVVDKLFNFFLQGYFPSIDIPEGKPVEIQDLNGKDWEFNFRYWPNNNSRMYVLEGFNYYVTSMKLKPGDTGNN